MSKTAKLTQSQVDLLIRMVNEGEELVTLNGKLWTQDREARWTGNVHGLTVKALVVMGYLKQSYSPARRYVVTASGRQALEDYNSAL